MTPAGRSVGGHARRIDQHRHVGGQAVFDSAVRHAMRRQHLNAARRGDPAQQLHLRAEELHGLKATIEIRLKKQIHLYPRYDLSAVNSLNCSGAKPEAARTPLGTRRLF